MSLYLFHFRSKVSYFLEFVEFYPKLSTIKEWLINLEKTQQTLIKNGYNHAAALQIRIQKKIKIHISYVLFTNTRKLHKIDPSEMYSFGILLQIAFVNKNQGPSIAY
jgi:hypothetical protein